MQDEHPPVGPGPGKLCLRSATACDPAFRSGYFRSKVSLLSGNHKRNITLASKMSCATANFAKGSFVLERENLPKTCSTFDKNPLSQIFLHSFRNPVIADLLFQGDASGRPADLPGHANPRAARIVDHRRRLVTRKIVERISVWDYRIENSVSLRPAPAGNLPSDSLHRTSP